MSSGDIDIATQEVPNRWYEKKWLIILSAVGVGTGMLQVENLLNSNEQAVWVARIASATIYITSRICDYTSTQAALDYLKENGNPTNIVESNPFIDTTNIYKFNFTNAIQYLLSGVAVISPTYGVSLGVAGFLATLNNRRKLVRSKVITDWE